MSFPSYHQIETLCRGCLMADRKMASVELYKSEFKDLTGINIAPTDGLPHWLCYECIALLKKCVGFRKKVMKSHYKLSLYVLDKVPFVSDKESSPQLSRSTIYCYNFPDNVTEEQQQELIIKTEENEMDLPVITNVESITPKTETPQYEDNVSENVCREEKAQLNDAIKLYSDDNELDNKGNASELTRSPSPKMAELLSLDNKNIDLVNLDHEERNDTTEVEEEEMPIANNDPDDKIENHRKENSDNDKIEVWCFSIDEQDELTTKSQRRASNRHKEMETEESSVVLMNTEKNAIIQATENADEHSDITSTLQKEDDEENVKVGNAKYACDKCNKCYTDKTLLKTHISRNHPQIKPFKCDVCMKGFGRKSTLTIHKHDTYTVLSYQTNAMCAS